ALGYRSPDDLRRNYPGFYWNAVAPYLKEALRYLALTHRGKQVLANLYSHVFVVEHESPRAAAPRPAGQREHTPASPAVTRAGRAQESDRPARGPLPTGRLPRDEGSNGHRAADVLSLPVQQPEAP